MAYNSDGSYTAPSGATNAFSGETIASATWNSIGTDYATAFSTPGRTGGLRIASRTVNFNPSVTVDVTISIPLPVGSSRYIVERVQLANASANISTAKVNLFTGAGGTGTAIVGSSTAVTVTTSASDTANNTQALTINSGDTISYNDTSLFFRITTPQGSAATADVILFIKAL